MTYTKRADLTPDTRAIAGMGEGVEARIAAIIESSAEGVLVELPNGDRVMAKRIIKPEMVGMVVELDTGELVQIEYTIKQATDSATPVIHVLATWVDDDLNGLAGTDRRPVAVEFKYNASQLEQDTLTLPVILRECLMLVLGEPLTLIQAPGGAPEDVVTVIPWGMEIVQGTDVRRAIRIARESTDVDLDVLL